MGNPPKGQMVIISMQQAQGNKANMPSGNGGQLGKN